MYNIDDFIFCYFVVYLLRIYKLNDYIPSQLVNNNVYLQFFFLCLKMRVFISDVNIIGLFSMYDGTIHIFKAI